MLVPRYADPYRVLRRVSDFNYCAEPVISSRDRHTKAVDTVHVERMKPYISPQRPVATLH